MIPGKILGKGGDGNGRVRRISPFATPTPFSEREPVAKATKKYSAPEANWVSTWNALDEQDNITKIYSE